MPVPPVSSWDVGVNPTVAILNARIRDAINFLKSPPNAVLRRTTSQAISSGVHTSVQWTSEDKDSDGGHTTASDTTPYYAKTAGFYYLIATVVFSGNVNGKRDVWFRKNGDANFRYGWYTKVPNADAGGADVCMCSVTHIRLEVDDYVEVFVHQNSGATLNLVASNADPRFEILWVAR